MELERVRATRADRLIAKFRKLSDVTQRDIVSKAVHHAAKTIVQADAKRLAPGNNGELRNSIKTRVKMDGDKAIGEVYTNLHYAPYVEFGTGPKGQASHSGISPEVSVSYRSSPWYVHEDQINVGPYHFQKIGEFYKMYGQPAQPYLYPALRDNQERVSKNISNYVRRKIRGTNKMINIKPVIYKELQKVADNVTDTYPSDWETFPVVIFWKNKTSPESGLTTRNKNHLSATRWISLMIPALVS